MCFVLSWLVLPWLVEILAVFIEASSWFWSSGIRCKSNVTTSQDGFGRRDMCRYSAIIPFLRRGKGLLPVSSVSERDLCRTSGADRRRDDGEGVEMKIDTSPWIDLCRVFSAIDFHNARTFFYMLHRSSMTSMMSLGPKCVILLNALDLRTSAVYSLHRCTTYSSCSK